MRVFKATYKDRKGRTREAAKWYVEFSDTYERIRRIPAFTSRAASEECGRKLEQLVAYHHSSGGQADPVLMVWLEGLPLAMRRKLVEIGLVDSRRFAAAKPLADHLDDFHRMLLDKGNTAKHARTVKGRAERAFTACGFRFFSDIDANALTEHLADLRKDTQDADGNTKQGTARQTSNFILGACQQFCRWMLKYHRAHENPLTHLSKLNVRQDRRHDRRALTADELRRLLEAAETGPERFGMAGAERRLCYRLAAESGLRSSELHSLTRASFDLKSEPPTVTVGAAYCKRGREDTLPLRPDTAAELATYMAGKHPGALAFNMPESDDTAPMIRADLEAAGIDYIDADGRFADFHALRHSFITNLANGGVHPKTAQALARHSTITLTMDRYSHSLRGQQADALDTLPDLSAPSAQSARATGTDNARAVQDATGCARTGERTTGRADGPSGNASDTGKGESVLASCLALSGGFHPARVGASGHDGKEALQPETPANIDESQHSRGFCSTRPAGLGPTTCGLEDRCSIQLSYRR